MDEIYRTTLFESAIRVAGLKAAHYWSRRFTIEGLQQYLDEVNGLAHSDFTAKELVTTSDHRAQGAILLPEILNWPRIAFLRYIADMCRKDKAVTVAWLWRPPWLNEAVGGAGESAHMNCCAIDLDFADEGEVERVLKEVLHPIYNALAGFGSAMGLGVGAKRIHVDFFSPAWEEKGRRPRWWAYASRPTYLGPKHPIS